MRFLRTNTAIRLTVGPFFDKTDGVTPETGLTVTSCKLTLMVDDGNVPTLALDASATASGGSNDMVHVTGDDAGFYDLELTAANLNYVGRAMLAITDAAAHCPVFHEFMILPAMVYDALVLGTDTLHADAQQWLGQTIAAVDTTGYPKVTIKSGTGTGEINLTSGAVPIKGNLKKNTAHAAFPFIMTATDAEGVSTPATGKTVTVTRSIDGGAFAGGTLGSVTEVAAGIYVVDFGAGDLNGNNIILRATATACDDTFERIVTYLA
jgi:hypothetical protein